MWPAHAECQARLGNSRETDSTETADLADRSAAFSSSSPNGRDLMVNSLGTLRLQLRDAVDKKNSLGEEL